MSDMSLHFQSSVFFQTFLYKNQKQFASMQLVVFDSSMVISSLKVFLYYLFNYMSVCYLNHYATLDNATARVPLKKIQLI
jgi:hypothetical protein